MEKHILVSSQPEETQVAIIEDSQVVELFINRLGDQKMVGDIYLAKVEKIMPSLEAMFLEAGFERGVYLRFADMINTDPSKIKKGDLLLVQITKGPISTKAAKGTMNISLPGRYMVYNPFNKHIGISQNINSHDERKRLRDIIKSFEIKKGGFIIRTEGEKVEEKVFDREAQYLIKLWEDIKNTISRTTKPGLIHKDFGIVFKVIRDKMSSDVETLVIDSFDEYKASTSFLEMISPENAHKVVYYNDKVPLFKMYGVDKVIKNIVKQKIYLHSGGYIIIQEAESLCAIDVNSGKGKGKTLEETILKTNLEAAEEIALQLRLRNIGGIIVIDFIDMYEKEHKEAVQEKLKELVKYDKAKIKILPLTALGLVEMTRERKSESVLSYLSEECPNCYGTGRIPSKETIYISILRELRNLKREENTSDITLKLNPNFKTYLTPTHLKQLKNESNNTLTIKYDEKIPNSNYEITLC